ncbi:MAG: prolyl-tRNA synthetase associated domain-containing protein [Clostridia bacterium]|nr:prolyl-tRNA synthetase associated domain-containing protein [Clostridia bacterium]
MDMQETLAVLRNQGIPFELFEHPAVMNMSEVDKLDLPYPEADAKNLFIRDARGHYCLISVPGRVRVDLKAFRRAEGLGSLSFVSEQEMQDLLALTPGSVTPLGLLSDNAGSVVLYLDEAFREGWIGVHPNDNRATVFLRTEDLRWLIEAHGNRVLYRRFSPEQERDTGGTE